MSPSEGDTAIRNYDCWIYVVYDYSTGTVNSTATASVEPFSDNGIAIIGTGTQTSHVDVRRETFTGKVSTHPDVGSDSQPNVTVVSRVRFAF
jgi:hypothetical protein